MSVNNYPPIDVVLVCYNQEEFIAQAIESILTQVYPGLINIYVGDDCSTDSTLKVVERYSSDENRVIHIVERKKNLGPTKNISNLLKICESPYVALLEGDDFWCNNEKLIKQVDFLQKNNEHSSVSHRYSTVDKFNNVLATEYTGKGKVESSEYTIDNFSEYGYMGFLGSIVFRNPKHWRLPIEEIANIDWFISDITINLALALEGKVKILDEVMAAHRIVILPTGSNYKSTIAKKNQIPVRIQYFNKLLNVFKQYYTEVPILKDNNAHYIAMSFLFFFRYPSIHNFKALTYVFKECGINFVTITRSLLEMLSFLKVYLIKMVRR